MTSQKLVEVQSSLLVQKKRNSIGFYLIPGLSKSDLYFSRNRPESKCGQFQNLTLDAMDHIFCLRRQYQKIALESSIIKIDWHMIRHYKAYLVYYMFLSHIYYLVYFVWTDTSLKRSKVTTPTKAYNLWPFSMNAVEYGNKINMYGINMFGRMFQL